MENRYLVYGLVDPSSGRLRYVGQTTQSLGVRLSEHLSRARRGCERYVYDWIRSLVKSGSVPSIRLLEECPSREEMVRAERRYILHLQKSECLTNLTSGGEGVEMTDATRRKLSEAARRQWQAKRDEMCRSLRGVPKSTLNENARPVVDGNGVVYRSTSAAGLALGLDPRAISRAAKRGWKVKGHTFGYAE
jgi:hypothetical protein